MQLKREKLIKLLVILYPCNIYFVFSMQIKQLKQIENSLTKEHREHWLINTSCEHFFSEKETCA